MEREQRPIQKLSGDVIGRIAAGEVVERPAAVVKELVENSIDAGATAITVELREGGVQYLRVTDNGCGIPSSQIRMAFERHATSKISQADDLFNVHTLGFRGEALASIAAVAKVSCTTRTAKEDFGIQARVEGGDMADVREAATPIGTTLLVKDLFFNTPVRLKFLKKPAMEASLVTDYMMRLILSRPDISFRYVNEGKTVYQSVGDGRIESALVSCFGKDAFRAMKRVRGNRNGVLVEGYVGVGELARGNRQQQSFFVNGRFFRDAELSKALSNACQGLVTIGKFPCCALYLQLAYEKVDVNVHPNKLEVRFQNPAGVAQAVEELTRNALREERLEDVLLGTKAQEDISAQEESIHVVVLKDGGHSTPGSSERPFTQTIETAMETQLETPSVKPAIIPAIKPMGSLRETYATRETPPFPSTAQQKTASLAADLPAASIKQETLLPEVEGASLRFIGSVFQTYLLFEAEERLLWVDQHAAHERILYDKFLQQYEGERISQRLLSPQLVRVSARESGLLAEWQPLLAEAGFDVQPFDDTAVAVHAIPTLFGKNEPVRELLLEALDEWQGERRGITQERVRKQVVQMACKRAVKAGDALSLEEVRHLLENMLATKVLPTCPHGRPIVVEVNRRDMEKRFKRVQ